MGKNGRRPCQVSPLCCASLIDCRQRRPTGTPKPGIQPRQRVNKQSRQRTQQSNPPPCSPSWITDEMGDPQRARRPPNSGAPPKSTIPIGLNPSQSTSNLDVTQSYINADIPETHSFWFGPSLRSVNSSTIEMALITAPKFRHRLTWRTL